MVIRIAQLNMDRARRAATEIRGAGVGQGIDILAIQEPYVGEGRVAGFGMGTTVVHGGRVDATGAGAAVVLLNRQVGLMKIQGLSNANCVVVQVMGGRRCSSTWW